MNKRIMLSISVFCAITSISMENAFGMKRVFNWFQSKPTSSQAPQATSPAEQSPTEQSPTEQSAAEQPNPGTAVDETTTDEIPRKRPATEPAQGAAEPEKKRARIEEVQTDQNMDPQPAPATTPSVNQEITDIWDDFEFSSEALEQIDRICTAQSQKNTSAEPMEEDQTGQTPAATETATEKTPNEEPQAQGFQFEISPDGSNQLAIPMPDGQVVKLQLSKETAIMLQKSNEQTQILLRLLPSILSMTIQPLQESLNQASSDIQGKMIELRGGNEALRKAITNLNKDFNRLTDEKVALQNHIKDLGEAHNEERKEMQTKLEAKEHEILAKQDEIGQARGIAKQLNERTTQLQTQLDAKTQEITTKQGEIGMAQGQAQELEKQLRERQTEIITTKQAITITCISFGVGIAAGTTASFAISLVPGGQFVSDPVFWVTSVAVTGATNITLIKITPTAARIYGRIINNPVITWVVGQPQPIQAPALAAPAPAQAPAPQPASEPAEGKATCSIQ